MAIGDMAIDSMAIDGVSTLWCCNVTQYWIFAADFALESTLVAQHLRKNVSMVASLCKLEMVDH